MRLGIAYESLPITATVWNENSPPEWSPQFWVVVTCAAPPAPTPAPTPAPVPPGTIPDITVGNYLNNILQVGDYWYQDGVWGAGSLTPGVYTGLSGSKYEQRSGVSKVVGPNGEVAARVQWKWPTGTTEVKSYPALLIGNKPGMQNSWTTPGGFPILLTDGSTSNVYPSGKTPNSWFPMQLPITVPITTTFGWAHNAAPTGKGHLSYDIWLQNIPTQTHGWYSQSEITHEIMIPLTNWGNYGSHPFGRNPAWYVRDVTIDGRLYHLYRATNFGNGWQFIVFQPDKEIASPGQLNLTSFINYIRSVGWANYEYLVSVELGVETVEGTGDMTYYNFSVRK